jgi:ABC-type transporter Mla subunit MlaD
VRGTRQAATGQAAKLTADARAAIDALHEHVASLEAQLEELAQQSQELERIKKALGRI